MDNPGPFLFTFGGGAFPVGPAGTYVGDWMTDFDGVTALSLQASFQWGSGGMTATVYFQTSLDQGATAIDIAAEQFATASAIEVVNLSGLTPQTAPVAPSQASLAPGTCVDGVLGDRFRAVVVVAGAYGPGTALNLWGVAR